MRTQYRLLVEHDLKREDFKKWILPKYGGEYEASTVVEVDEEDLPKGAMIFDVPYEEKDRLKKEFGILWNRKRKSWWMTEDRLKLKGQTVEEFQNAILYITQAFQRVLI